MEPFIVPVQLRWSDFDANYHLRHSAYYDFGAMARIALFEKIGITAETFQQYQFGPILFKEACVFRKEITMHDEIRITTQMIESRLNGSRFCFIHQLLRKDDVLSAEITIHGDWIDFKTRKLWHPLPFLAHCMDLIPRHPQFKQL